MTFESHLSSLRAEITPLPTQAWVDANDPAGAARQLVRDGFVVIRNFIERSVALTEAGRIAVDLNRYLPQIREFTTQEYPEVLIHCRAERFGHYREIAASPKPVFNIRNSWGEDAPDAGLVDLFHPGKVFTNLQPLVDTLATGYSATVLSHVHKVAGGPPYTPRHSNLYINMGVTGTRGFHFDSHTPHVKAFLYLTDVLRMEDGPYCYVPGSHRENLIKTLNRRYNTLVGHRPTDMFLTDPADGVAFIAPAGTLILTVQTGIHRGYPQGENGWRLALIQVFSPAS